MIARAPVRRGGNDEHKICEAGMPRPTAQVVSPFEAQAFSLPFLPAPVPELPEVETIRRGLETGLQGRRIIDVEFGAARLRKPSPLPWSVLQDRTVVRVHRHAKVLGWDLDDGTCASIHLGMTGKFLFMEPGAPARPHTHLRLFLDDGRELHYSDPRRFGWFTLHESPTQDTAHYGMDALDPAWDAPRLASLMAGSRAPMKAFLMDQTRMAGLGNIYVCEALWRARISPRRQARNVARSRHPILLQHIQEVLHEALDRGGTSFNDYVNSIGQPGSFVADLAVFQRAGRPCPRCGATIRRIIQSGRSTFYCGACQR